jgi:hypothetical protein
MKALPDELGRDEDEQAVDAVHAAMYKALRWAESMDSRAPPSDEAVMAWRTAIEAFEDGYSTYAAILILGLCDVGGQELPVVARNFFHLLIARLLENKNKRGLPRREVRVRFKIYSEAERKKGRTSRLHGESVDKVVVNDLIKMYGCSYGAIDEIVRPRASRPHLKRHRFFCEPE